MNLTSIREIDPSSFHVKGMLGNTHIQSLLASSKLRRRLKRKVSAKLIAHQRDCLFDGGDGIRLHGIHSPQPALNNSEKPDETAPLVIMLHGWEGSAESTYLLSAASALYNQGFSILRLHLRDHGPSAHLNPDLFNAARLDEVVNAINDAQTRLPYQNCYLVGFSLGGNFALRISLQAKQQAIDLQHVAAISPVFSPKQTMHALESGSPLYRYYFLKKWKRALSNKQAHFPDRYNFSDLLESNSLMAMTCHLVEQHTEFSSVEDYFTRYTLDAKAFDDSAIPTDVILAADDPVIPVSGTEAFSSSQYFRLRIFKQGGHCGFIQNWRFESWLDQELIRLFSNQNKEFTHSLTSSL